MATDDYETDRRHQAPTIPVTCFVRIETRKRGAIGAFAWSKHLVSAADKEDAARKVFEDMQRTGHETRGVWAEEWQDTDKQRQDAYNPHPPVDWAG